MNFHNETSQTLYFSMLGKSMTNTCKTFQVKGVNQVVEKQGVKSRSLITFVNYYHSTSFL